MVSGDGLHGLETWPLGNTEMGRRLGRVGTMGNGINSYIRSSDPNVAGNKDRKVATEGTRDKESRFPNCLRDDNRIIGRIRIKRKEGNIVYSCPSTTPKVPPFPRFTHVQSPRRIHSPA